MMCIAHPAALYFVPFSRPAWLATICCADNHNLPASFAMVFLFMLAIVLPPIYVHNLHDLKHSCILRDDKLFHHG